MLAPTLDLQIITISGNGESPWSLAVLLYGLPWSWVAVGLWTYFVARLGEREERLTREDLSSARGEPKVVIGAASVAAVLVALLAHWTLGDSTLTLGMAVGAAVAVGRLCARFPASVRSVLRRKKTEVG
jgi:hypothetical protein